MVKVITVLCTAGTEENAYKLAETLINENLAACINVVPGVVSFYKWKGTLNRDQEWLLIIKTVEELFDQLEKRIKELHEYSIPEIIALPVEHGSKEYLQWVVENAKLR